MNFTIREVTCKQIIKAPNGDFLLMNCKGDLVWRLGKLHKGVDFSLRISKLIMDKIINDEYEKLEELKGEYGKNKNLYSHSYYGNYEDRISTFSITFR